MEDPQDAFQRERERMVQDQLERRGIKNRAVLDAMRTVPRDRFVPEQYRAHAYADRPLPISKGQTISQPFMVATMIEAVAPKQDERVLEIGTGSGYGAAVLGRIADEVHTVERVDSLAARARDVFDEIGYDNIDVHIGDGTRGWPDAAPYDVIVVTAAGPEIPTTLRDQLAEGGRLIMPVGAMGGEQRLVRLTRVDAVEFREEDLGEVSFVPLIGAEGWRENGQSGPIGWIW